jgi:hypothetical protein
MIKVTGMAGEFPNLSVSTVFFAGTGETRQRAACIDGDHKGELFFTGEEITSILQPSIDLVE